MKTNTSNVEGAPAVAVQRVVRLTVYAIKAYGNYGGGMAIVAAENEEAAKKLATGCDSNWHTRYHEPESIEALPVSYEGHALVLAHYATGE